MHPAPASSAASELRRHLLHLPSARFRGAAAPFVAANKFSGSASKNQIVPANTYTHETLIVPLSELNELVSLLCSLLDLALSLLVLHLEHAYTIPQQLDVVLNPRMAVRSKH